MGLILRLSLRNLLRQKRRNILLGTGIAFGMMILVIASSFSHGMVDVLINDIVSNAFGHLVVDSRIGNSQLSMIREKAPIIKVIKETIAPKDLVRIDESISTFGRGVGNGATDNVVVVGLTPKNEADKVNFFRNFFTLVHGKYSDFFSPSIDYPVVISESKAKSLNVKLHDVIRIRIPMVTGQIETAKLTVVAIANANNSFMDIVVFMEGNRLKKLLGYKPWESAGLQITLKDPKATAKKYADILHDKFKPTILSITGTANEVPGELLAFKNDNPSKNLLQKRIRLVNGDPKQAFGKEGVLISTELSKKLGVDVDQEFYFKYHTRYRGDYEEKLKVKGVYEPLTPIDTNTILVNGERIYSVYGRYLPATTNRLLIKDSHPLYEALAMEWKLLPRSKDSEALQSKYRLERRTKTDQLKMDIMTMYEGASDILKLEGVMNGVTLFAVLILFFIILIGVINTLRMTVKERTREIGTVRAIGMQDYDVRHMFIAETMLLTVLSCLAGILLGLIVIYILGSFQFNVHNALSIILKNKHLYFKPNPVTIFWNFLLIMIISAFTAFFPAQRAAKLKAVEALRHYE
ncbi:MAG TPA: FtsX-like permease family protein [Bacillota bacterium]|nr:FtsX-like permease family protein [Bacillota bacterium]